MKTFNQIKDCHAIDLGYNSFADLVLHPKKDMKMNHLNWCIERSAQEYAKQVAEQALKDAAENATATTIYEDPFDFYNTTIRGYEIDKESITDTEIKLP